MVQLLIFKNQDWKTKSRKSNIESAAVRLLKLGRCLRVVGRRVLAKRAGVGVCSVACWAAKGAVLLSFEALLLVRHTLGVLFAYVAVLPNFCGTIILEVFAMLARKARTTRTVHKVWLPLFVADCEIAMQSVVR